MSQYNEAMGHALLEEATQRLRDARSVEMPLALVASTVSAIRNRPMPAVRRRTVGGWALRLGSLAATILLALAGVSALWMKVVNDKEAEGFRVRGIKLFGVKSDKGEMHVWVDATMLPLRIELRMGETLLVTFAEMKWNPAIDPALLSMEIPAGYSEQPADAFQKLLRPKADADKVLTPTEAFRKWRGESK